jgi:multiple sugar transport system permease protein
MAPYLILFLIFIIIPTVMAVGLSFTNYNAVQTPQFVGLTNYINLLTQDTIFLQYVLPNTILFSLVVGPVGYMLAFFLAWSLSQLTKLPRTILALILYSPSMTMGVAMTVMWRVVFLGNQSGIANYALTQLGIITEPIVWMLNTDYILPIVIIVALWGSMGVGFLAMLAGLLDVNPELYEAAAIDGASNTRQFFTITIPLLGPVLQMVLMNAVLGSLKVTDLVLTLTNGRPNGKTEVMMTYIYKRFFGEGGSSAMDYGYGAALTVVTAVILTLVTLLYLRATKKNSDIYGE